MCRKQTEAVQHFRVRSKVTNKYVKCARNKISKRLINNVASSSVIMHRLVAFATMCLCQCIVMNPYAFKRLLKHFRLVKRDGSYPFHGVKSRNGNRMELKSSVIPWTRGTAVRDYQSYHIIYNFRRISITYCHILYHILFILGGRDKVVCR